MEFCCKYFVIFTVIEQIVVEQQIEHQREIKVPIKTMEKQMVMVPRQQMVYHDVVCTVSLSMLCLNLQEHPSFLPFFVIVIYIVFFYLHRFYPKPS